MIRAGLAALAALLLLAAACQGGDGDSPDPVATPTLSASPTAAGCTPARTFAAGDTVQSISSGGAERTYRLHIPPSYDGSQPVALVMLFHGFGQPSSFLEVVTAFPALADQEGFITIAPDAMGTPALWNNYLIGDRADDVTFIRDLLTSVENELCLDPARTYAAGYSGGGGMVQRLACDMSDQFEAVGLVSGYYTNCAGNAPFIAFHGKSDPVVPYDGGPSTAFPSVNFLPARRTLSEWAQTLGCDGLGLISRPSDNVELSTFPRCLVGENEALFYTILNGGHTWPGSDTIIPEGIVGFTTQEVDATELMWEFFQAHAPR